MFEIIFYSLVFGFATFFTVAKISGYFLWQIIARVGGIYVIVYCILKFMKVI
jgi:hypothetical protein